MNILSKSAEAIRVEIINRQIPIPLYYQIAQHLRGEIREHGMRPGDLLGTEEEIQKTFRVSRATARKALEELAEEGLVTRITGKGTYVAKPRLAVQLPTLLSFSEEMKRMGMVPRSRVIEASFAPPDEEVAINLMIEDESQVLRLERIRYADDTPMAHTIDCVPTWVGLRPGMDFTGSLYELLETAGVRPEESVHVIEGTSADPALAGYLDVPLGSPVLRCRDTTSDASGCPVLFSIHLWRGDRYSYQVRLKRPAAVGR
jgi:GntR family transcriptional regulator